MLKSEQAPRERLLQMRSPCDKIGALKRRGLSPRGLTRETACALGGAAVEKRPGEILNLALDGATFQGTGAGISPTCVNFLFGRNGTGKSTIARAIRNGAGVTFAPGRTTADYLFLVFDQDFIDENVRSYHSLPGVFTLGAANVEIQEQIDEKAGEVAAIQADRAETAGKIREKEKERETLAGEFLDSCWNETAALRKEFREALSGHAGSKKRLMDEVRRHPPMEHDTARLRRAYDAIYAKGARAYERLNEIADVTVLDRVPGGEILAVPIVNASSAGLSEFFREIGAGEWVRQGRARFQDAAGGRCPYCGRPLGEELERELSDSFDRRYEENLQRLSAFLEEYRRTANTLFLPLSRLPEESYPAADLRLYRQKLEAVRSVISANTEQIRAKIQEPSRVVSLRETAGALQELSDTLCDINRMIDENNAAVAAGPERESACRNAVFEHLAWMLKDKIAAQDARDAALAWELNKLRGSMDLQSGAIRHLQEEIRRLNGGTVDTSDAVEAVNRILRDTGFQGFEMRPRPEEAIRPDGTTDWVVVSPARHYEVVRTQTGEVADSLSEGERNFIAFLYFRQQVYGSPREDGETRRKIIVLDDPVSGMDSAAASFVSGEVRRMAEQCLAGADTAGSGASGGNLRQMFVLTHDRAFFREVTAPYGGEYDLVSFYLLGKKDNRSSVRLCETRTTGRAASRVNVNPVKDPYTALWEEYREVSGTAALCGVIRRILAAYFLQICGYGEDDLRREILEGHRYEFTHDSRGNEDSAKYDLASEMLSGLAGGPGGARENRYFVEQADAETCRETFELIFRCLGQGRHYEKMMRTV